jgi:hypothetical protein
MLDVSLTINDLSYPAASFLWLDSMPSTSRVAATM